MAAIGQKAQSVKAVLKKFYDKNTIRRIAFTVIAVLLLIYVIVSIPVWTLGSEKLVGTSSRQPLEGTEISLETGKVVVAQNGGKTLTLDTTDMSFEVKDDVS